MTRNEALRQLMLGLIYPAVLGTVLYSVLAAALSPLISLLNKGVLGPFAPGLKWVLVITTVAFYVCDYLYIMFTREFRFLFFIFDLILLAGLYLTFMTIDITTHSLPHKNLTVVAASYGVFVFLYFVWDVLERRSTRDDSERSLYLKVIIWEGVSFIALLLWFCLHAWMENDPRSAVVLAGLLILITVRFGILALRKRQFYRPPMY
jgi:hypothetical protein